MLGVELGGPDQWTPSWGMREVSDAIGLKGEA